MTPDGIPVTLRSILFSSGLTLDMLIPEDIRAQFIPPRGLDTMTLQDLCLFTVGAIRRFHELCEHLHDHPNVSRALVLQLLDRQHAEFAMLGLILGALAAAPTEVHDVVRSAMSIIAKTGMLDIEHYTVH